MPNFERIDESDGIEYLSIYDKESHEILSMFTTFIEDKDQVLSIVVTYPYETGGEKILEMMSYTKDRELLQEIFEDIPQLFAQYIKQDDLNKKLSKTYSAKHSDLSREEYTIYVSIYSNSDRKNNSFYLISLKKTIRK